MTPTSRSVQTEIDGFLTYLIDSEIAVYTNLISNQQGRVTWRPFPAVSGLLPTHGPPSVLDYRNWLISGSFSALLYDGALLQITYDFEGSRLTGHRLAFVPCPFRLDLDLLQTEPLQDVVDLYIAAGPEDVVLHSAVRFDYDPSHAAEHHPATHLTINSADCRIACLAPLRLGQFVDFVFRNFYPWLWELHPFLRRLPLSAIGPRRTVTEDQSRRPHVAWLA
jgi:Uncharacterized conserved protein (DUF2290)